MGSRGELGSMPHICARSCPARARYWACAARHRLTSGHAERASPRRLRLSLRLLAALFHSVRDLALRDDRRGSLRPPAPRFRRVAAGPPRAPVGATDLYYVKRCLGGRALKKRKTVRVLALGFATGGGGRQSKPASPGSSCAQHEDLGVSTRISGKTTRDAGRNEER